MNKNIILILLFLFCCRSSPEKSFINLSDAFINWYFRYNPIESTRYNIYNSGRSYIKYDQLNIKTRDNYCVMYKKMDDMALTIERLKITYGYDSNYIRKLDILKDRILQLNPEYRRINK